MANQIATDLGFYTKQMEDRLAAVKKAQTGAPAAVVLVDPPLLPDAPTPPTVVAAGGPETPSTSGSGPIVPAVPSGSIPTPGPIPVPGSTEAASTSPTTKPVVTPEVPTAPQPRTVASGPIVPGIPPVPSVPQAPAVAAKAPSAGEQMLDQARHRAAPRRTGGGPPDRHPGAQRQPRRRRQGRRPGAVARDRRRGHRPQEGRRRQVVRGRGRVLQRQALRASPRGLQAAQPGAVVARAEGEAPQVHRAVLRRAGEAPGPGGPRRPRPSRRARRPSR